jgi:phenylalanyl-tRNA synthetase beta chain
MRLPLSWLREFLPDLPDPDTLAKRLTSLGIEVEAIETVTADFRGVVIAEVRSVAPHPQAERLRIAQVWDGQTLTPVVCGAPNCRTGLRVAWARPGSVLPTADGPQQIQTATLRGIESFGMLCSTDELGLGLTQEGIWELGEDAELGALLEDSWTDTVFHLSLTPNLGHALSVLGIAREISASLEIPLHDRATTLNELDSLPKGHSVQVDDGALCPQYHLLSCSGAWASSSPLLWQKRLLLSGLRPIHPVVDVTNLLLLERGQPMHGFEASQVDGPLAVRLGRSGEDCLLLDQQQKSVDRLLVIADQQGPVAVAGVMGGARTAVGSAATSVLLECAVFSPSAVRKASKQLGVRSESSYRFERGIDEGGCRAALERALELLRAVGGRAIGLSGVARAVPSVKIRTHRDWLTARLGMPLSQGEIEQILRRLRCEVESAKDELIVVPPSDRNDLREPIDLVEELARLYGYDHLTRAEPSVQLGTLPPDPIYTGLERAREALVAQGLQEFLTPALISPADAALIGHPLQVAVSNPASEDHSVLRPSLLPGLIRALQTNQARREGAVAAFEVGRVHGKQGPGIYQEPWTAGIVLCGTQAPAGWSQAASEWDFFSAKGLVEAWSKNLELPSAWSWQRSDHPLFHPHRQATLLWDRKQIGQIGELHPALVKQMGLRGRPVLGEWALEPLIEEMEKPQRKLKAPPEFPSTERDLTLNLPKTFPVAAVEQAIADHRPETLESWALTTVFPDPSEQRIHHVTWRFQYRDTSRTLTGAEVDAAQAGLVEKLVSALASVQQ